MAERGEQDIPLAIVALPKPVYIQQVMLQWLNACPSDIRSFLWHDERDDDPLFPTHAGSEPVSVLLAALSQPLL